LERFLKTGRCEALDESREFVGKRKDGSTFPMDLGVSRVQLGNRRLFTGILRDATERHARQKAERALLVTEENLRVARNIQQGFFPATAPQVPGIDIGGASFPAEATGGDYYDYLPMSDRHLGIVLGDVSGHGIGPALLMSQTHAFLHALVPACGDASELASRLNSFLTEGINVDRFITLFLAQIDPLHQNFFYAGAGHNGFLFDTDGEVHHLAATGLPLGVTGDPIPNSPTIPFKPGQILATLTDGVYETAAPDQTMFGIQRALDFIWEHRSRPAGDIVNALYLAASDHAQGEEQQDDITIVIVKFE
jgi:sigma-B regulation protein RsbU (phosphoserine phosphatase)